MNKDGRITAVFTHKFLSYTAKIFPPCSVLVELDLYLVTLTPTDYLGRGATLHSERAVTLHDALGVLAKIIANPDAYVG